MKGKSLPTLAMAVFLMTVFVGIGSVSAFNGKVLFREVSTERVISDWMSIFGNKTHEFHMRTDGVTHINAIALETDDPSIIRVVIDIVFHGEIGLRLILLETGDVIEEIIIALKTSQNMMIGTMSIEGPENTIAFSRTVRSEQLMGIEMRINGFFLIKTLNGEIQWLKAWVFMDHEKIPVPPPPIPTP